MLRELLKKLSPLHGAKVQSRDKVNIVRLSRGMYLATSGSKAYVVAVFSVKRANASEIHSMLDLVRRVRRFIATLCSGGCTVCIATAASRESERYIKEIEAMITNKTVEYEYDRANARIRRELKILKTIHDKLVSGYIPLRISTTIAISCPISSAEEAESICRAIADRADIASRILGLEVERVDVSLESLVTNFRALYS
ncbi:MAG: hypothetical protein GXO32_08615 [Crenarchaeota archaeon]|nr:hypothetical protein [Thermoproteota archaeon]